MVRRVGAIFGRHDSIALMRRLVTEIRGQNGVREGLRKAVAEHMRNRFVGNTKAATSGQGTIKSDQFQEFIRQNRAVLHMVFDANEMGMLSRIAEDPQRANRSVAAVRLPGGSNTAQDTFAIGDCGSSLLGKIMQAAAASGGFVASGGWGALGSWLGTRAVMQMRQAGVQRVDELIRDAMLDPGLARILLSKARIQPDKGPTVALGLRYRQSIGKLPAIGGAQERE